MKEKHKKLQGNNKSKGSDEGFPCPICLKVLMSKSSLKLHNRLHTNEKPYTCEYCGLKFRWGTSYNNHLKSHQKNLPQCPVEACGRRFSKRERLDVHFQSVHIQMLEPPPVIESCEVKRE